jgi:hypothetical protein
VFFFYNRQTAAMNYFKAFCLSPPIVQQSTAAGCCGGVANHPLNDLSRSFLTTGGIICYLVLGVKSLAVSSFYGLLSLWTCVRITKANILIKSGFLKNYGFVVCCWNAAGRC